MKILAVTSSFLPEVGGMQYSTHQTLLALVKKGAEVELICPKHSASTETDKQIPYKVTRISGGSYIAAFYHLVMIRRKWKQNKYDQLLLMGHHEEIAFGIANIFYPVHPIILAAGTRLHFSGTRIKIMIRNFILCNAYKKAEKIIAISPGTKKCIALYCKGIVTPFFIIPRPIDGSIWKRRRKKNGTDFTLVTFGRLEKAKNIQGVLEIIERLRNKIPTIKYWIVGDGEYKTKLKDMVKSLNIEKNVIFFSSLPQMEIAKKIQDVDVCILLSQSNGGESFGRVYVESAALGIPSIGYSSQGVTVAVNHEVTGFLCEKGDIKCVESALYKLYKDPLLMKKMQDNSLKHYQTKFTLEIVGKKIMEALYYE